MYPNDIHASKGINLNLIKIYANNKTYTRATTKFFKNYNILYNHHAYHDSCKFHFIIIYHTNIRIQVSVCSDQIDDNHTSYLSHFYTNPF